MVEHRLAKARAAGSNPVSCFFYCPKLLVPASDLGFFIFQSECEEGNIVHRCGILLFAFKCEKKREIIKLFSENYDIIRQKEFRDKGNNYL